MNNSAYLAQVIQQTQPVDNSIRTGTVYALDGTTLRVLINGGIVEAGYLASVNPKVGQTVAVLQQGADWLVLGAMAGPASPANSVALVRETKVVGLRTNVTGTTYADDPYLFVEMPAEGWYSIDLRVTYKSLSTGLNQRFTFPSGAITWAGSFDYDPGTDEWQTLAATISPGLTVVGLASSTTAGALSEVPLRIHGSIKMGGNAGRLQWQRAQNTASGATQIYEGSYLRVERLNWREEG